MELFKKKVLNFLLNFKKTERFILIYAVKCISVSSLCTWYSDNPLPSRSFMLIWCHRVGNKTTNKVTFWQTLTCENLSCKYADISHLTLQPGVSPYLFLTSTSQKETQKQAGRLLREGGGSAFRLCSKASAFHIPLCSWQGEFPNQLSS